MADRRGDLTAAGVAIWLDDLSRARLADGSLPRLVRDCQPVGVTTNPTIFPMAISGSDRYDGQIRDLGARGETTLRAVADHGTVRGDTIRDGYDDAAEVMAELADAGIDNADVDEQFERDGLTTIRASWAALTETLGRKLADARRGGERNDHP